MSTPDREKQLIDHVRTSLDEAVDSLDSATLSRLNQARHQALAARSAEPRLDWRRLGVPAGATVLAALLLLLATPHMLQYSNPVSQPKVLADLDILTDPEAIDFCQDLDFFFWLAEDEDYAG